MSMLILLGAAPLGQLLADLLRQGALDPLEDRQGLLGTGDGFFMLPQLMQSLALGEEGLSLSLWVFNILEDLESLIAMI